MQALLANYPNLEIRAASVHDLIWTAPEMPVNVSTSPLSFPNIWARVGGVRLGEEASSLAVVAAQSLVILTVNRSLDTGEEISCPSVVLCTGTFLSGEGNRAQVHLFRFAR
jgi:tRNA uridine 5-carboxymethylaminomethyl modification enzyme